MCSLGVGIDELYFLFISNIASSALMSFSMILVTLSEQVMMRSLDNSTTEVVPSNLALKVLSSGTYMEMDVPVSVSSMKLTSLFLIPVITSTMFLSIVIRLELVRIKTVLLGPTAWIAAMLCTGKSEPSMLIVFLVFIFRPPVNWSSCVHVPEKIFSMLLQMIPTSFECKLHC